MNDSSFQFVGLTLKKANRTRLLRTKSRLFCQECKTLQQVVDVFPNREALLECSHRRSLITDQKVINDYEVEKKKRGKSRTGWQAGAVMLVEEIEEIA